MQIIDYFYLSFIVLSLYFTILFLLIFFDKQKEIMKAPLAKKYEPLTILMPAHNEEDSILDSIMSIKNSKYPKNLLKIIVIDDASTDNTPSILKKIKGIKIITNKKNTGSAACATNTGLKQVKTKYVAVVDADSFIGETALSRMLAMLQSDVRVGAVTSAITARDNHTFLQKLQDIEYSIIVWVRKLLQSVDSIYVTPGPLAMYRTKALKELNGFDEKNITQDIEIAWRMMYNKYKIRMSLQSKVKVTTPANFKAWWRQRLRWAMGGLQTLWKYRHTLFRKKYGMLGKFVGPFFLLSLFTSLSGFGVFSYMIIISIMRWFYLFFAPSSSFNYIRTIIGLPSVFLYFGIIIFILSLVYVYFGLRTMDNKKYLSLKNFNIIHLFIYLTMYVTVFPIVLLTAMYRLARGDVTWY
jgi:cellulose synthase/poly-beta-1,6-N-acetylglucosamine synthase-like glycosyltransferase